MSFFYTKYFLALLLLARYVPYINRNYVSHGGDGDRGQQLALLHKENVIVYERENKYYLSKGKISVYQNKHSLNTRSN